MDAGSGGHYLNLVGGSDDWSRKPLLSGRLRGGASGVDTVPEQEWLVAAKYQQC